MSLFDKTKEELCEYMIKNYLISEETKNIILNELIDGEILHEFDDKDFEILKLKSFSLITLKYDINQEKAEKKLRKVTKDILLDKLKEFKIINPDDYINLDIEKMNLKIGQKKLLKKYMNIISSYSIDIHSNEEEILNYFKNKLNLSDYSIKNLAGITGFYFFKMNEKKIDILNIDEEDKTKLKSYLKNINKNAENKSDINEIEKKKLLEEMILFHSENIEISMKQLYEKLNEEKELILKNDKKNKLSIFNPYKLKLVDDIYVNINTIIQNFIFDFNIGNIFAKNILIEPIKGKIDISESLLFDIEIISQNQIDYIIKELEIKKPFCLCEQCKDDNIYNFFNLIKHSKCNNILIYDMIKFLELNNEEDFANFFPEKNKTQFSSSIDFDRNFNEYFNRKKYIKPSKKFIYYNDIE